jgi:hypothetical protein
VERDSDENREDQSARPMADFLDDKSTLDANSRVVLERVGGASQLTAGRVIVYKNRSGQERGDPRIIPPLRNRPL